LKNYALKKTIWGRRADHMQGVDFGQTAHVQLHYSHVGFLQAAFRYPWMGEVGVSMGAQ
jgi:hypothetical protein